MALILNIDTSTSVCSVALAKDGKVIAIKENNEGLNHSVLLGTYIHEVLQEHALEVQDLDAVAVSMGPGSYTGLRIGVSLAKGLCFGAGKPLIAIPTLQALALAVSAQLKEEALYCPMIDARRMEVYAAVYDRGLNVERAIAADIVDETSYLEYLDRQPVYFYGNGAAKCREKITHPNAHFIDDIHPLAKMMFPLAERQ